MNKLLYILELLGLCESGALGAAIWVIYMQRKELNRLLYDRADD